MAAHRNTTATQLTALNEPDADAGPGQGTAVPQARNNTLVVAVPLQEVWRSGLVGSELTDLRQTVREITLECDSNVAHLLDRYSAWSAINYAGPGPGLLHITESRIVTTVGRHLFVTESPAVIRVYQQTCASCNCISPYLLQLDGPAALLRERADAQYLLDTVRRLFRAPDERRIMINMLNSIHRRGQNEAWVAEEVLTLMGDYGTVNFNSHSRRRLVTIVIRLHRIYARRCSNFRRNVTDQARNGIRDMNAESRHLVNLQHIFFGLLRILTSGSGRVLFHSATEATRASLTTLRNRVFDFIRYELIVREVASPDVMFMN